MKYYPIAEKDKSIYLFETPFLSGFTTRLGGVSKENFESFNLYYGRGDTKENVQENYSILRNKINFSGPIIFPQQVHGNNIYILDRIPHGNKIIVPQCDAIVTKKKNIMIGVKFADCVPILVYGKKYAGLIHSGWRGTLKMITNNALNIIVEHGEKKEDINIILGPYIQRNNYEIGNEVKKKFIENGFNEEIFNISGNKHLLSLGMAIERSIKEKYPNINIFDTSLDTYSQKELFFSYRRDGYKCGEHIMFMVL